MAARDVQLDVFDAPSLPRQAADACDRFRAVYGQPPRWAAAAPGRVNLIGEHTDYNGGFVLPLAIERYVVVAAARPLEPTPDRIRLLSTLLDEDAQFQLDDLQPQRRDWTSYVRGVVAGCMHEGFDVGALDILIDSRVPLGGGLSSSAALEVATATLLESVEGCQFDPVHKARLCQRAEHEFAGMPCGIMDQFSSALGVQGNLLLIDCRSETAELVPLDDASVSVLVVNSNVRHELTGSEYSDRRADCQQAAAVLGVDLLRDVSPEELRSQRDKLDQRLYRRARHVVGENERTIAAAAALQAGDWATVGELMYASHDSLRDDYEVSCPELDALVDSARDLGAAEGVL
ncbi:MAG TPA: galactokinase, partial [Lacipirellulaceae bacterium]|nr:galactokinase [Lacipirellulaceae bacterium]